MGFRLSAGGRRGWASIGAHSTRVGVRLGRHVSYTTRLGKGGIGWLVWAVLGLALLGWLVG